MTLDGTRNYLVGERKALLIDPGPGDEAQEERIARLTEGDVRVTGICLTHAHRDHAGGACRLASALKAPLAASRRTLRRLGTRGRALADGDVLEVDGGARTLTALETPGHARDHLSFLLLPDRVLFTGDLVLGRGSSLVAHPDGSVESCVASLGRLLTLRPALLLPGHGDPVEDAGERLARYRRHRLDRSRQVREALAAGARSIRQIRERVYPELPEALEGAAGASVRAHLEHLRSQGTALPRVRGLEEAGHVEGEGAGGAG